MKKKKLNALESKAQVSLTENQAQVSLHLSATIHKGDFENVKVNNVGLTLPCDATDKGIKEAYEKVHEIVHAMLKREIIRLHKM